MAEHSKAKSTKPRHKNLDIAEKHFLLDVLPESIDVLEKKRNDFQTNSVKAQDWARVYERFRRRYGNARDLKEIKEQWKRIKIEDS